MLIFKIKHTLFGLTFFRFALAALQHKDAAEDNQTDHICQGSRIDHEQAAEKHKQPLQLTELREEAANH